MHESDDRATPLRIAFHILRSLSPVEDGPVLDVVPVQQSNRRVLIWPGSMPRGELPQQGHFGLRVVSGFANSRPVWIEERPMGPLLSDITKNLDRHTLDHVHLGISQALLELHRAGSSHGNLSPDRVLLTYDGRIVLLGAGRIAGSIEDDVRAWMAMEDSLASKMGPSLFGLWRYPEGSIAEWEAMLAQMPSSSFRLNRRQIDAAPTLPSDPPLLEVFLSTENSRGSIDEVGFDIGQDAHNSGVLEEWTSGTDEESAEQTGTLSSEVLNEQKRLALLARLGVTPNEKETPEHIEALNGTPITTIRELLLTETLEALPSPGLLDCSVRADREETSSGEVTRARYKSLLTTSEFEEDTAANLEPTESFERSVEVTRVHVTPLPSENEKASRRIRVRTVFFGMGWVLAFVALFWL